MNGHICGGPAAQQPSNSGAPWMSPTPFTILLTTAPAFLLLLPSSAPLEKWCRWCGDYELRTAIGNCDCIDPSAQRPLICHSCYSNCCWCRCNCYCCTWRKCVLIKYQNNKQILFNHDIFIPLSPLSQEQCNKS